MTTKKILSVFIFALVFAVLISVFASAETVSPDLKNVNEGDTVTVYASLRKPFTVRSGAVVVGYDSSAYELVGGKCLLSDAMLKAFGPGNDGVFAFEEPTEISGNIFEIRFKVKDINAAKSGGIDLIYRLHDSSDKEMDMSEYNTVSGENDDLDDIFTPAVTTVLPTVTTARPIVTTTVPIVTTTAPTVTTTAPTSTTALPVTTTAPTVTADASAATTSAATSLVPIITPPGESEANGNEGPVIAPVDEGMETKKIVDLVIIFAVAASFVVFAIVYIGKKNNRSRR